MPCAGGRVTPSTEPVREALRSANPPQIQWPLGTVALDTGEVGRRERWFDEGAAALRRTLTAEGMQDELPPAGQFYACPLCLMTYGRQAFDGGVFTDEHVPPRHAGGRALVLTCRRCNNTAGSTMDADAERREAMHNFFAGRSSGRDLRAEFAVGDVKIKGNIDSTSGAILLSVVPKANNPRDVAEMCRTLEAWAAEGVGGRIGFRFAERVSLTSARLSWVRAAYLAAFAAFGWRYVFLSCLNPLRAQLADPPANILPPLALLDPGASPERRQLLVVQDPHELRSLAVVLGRYTVFLPGLEENPQPFAALATVLARFFALPMPRRQCVGKQVPWPAEPRYALD
jgi:HNH endonuclease